MNPAKLLIVDPRDGLRHVPRAMLIDILRAGELIVAHDAATLPASLHGTHVPSGASIEVRLAGRPTTPPRWTNAGATGVADFCAVVFGAGDFHTRTEDRPQPPALSPGDALALGPLSAVVTALGAIIVASGVFAFLFYVLGI